MATIWPGGASASFVFHACSHLLGSSSPSGITSAKSITGGFHAVILSVSFVYLFIFNIQISVTHFPPLMDNLYFYVLPILFLFLYNVRLYFLHRIQNLPPAPFPSLPFLGHLYLFITRKPLHRAFSKLSKRYGPVVFLQLGSRRALIVSSPVIAQECFTKNDIIFANRPNLLNGKVFGYNYTSLAWSPYGDHWRNLRRISSLHLLSSHKVKMNSNIQADEARILIRKFVRLANDNPNKDVEFKWILFEFTFNVITRMITGKNYKLGAEIFREITSEISRVTMEANVVDFLPYMKWFGFKNTEKKMRLIQMKRDKFMQNIIEEHRRIVLEDDSVKEKSTLQILLDLQREEPEYYSDETIRNLLLVRTSETIISVQIHFLFKTCLVKFKITCS